MTAEHGARENLAAKVAEPVASLRRLLEQQVAYARKGSFRQVEQLGEATSAAVAGISQGGDAVKAALDAQRGDLMRLYRELTLMLRGEQADMQDRLKRLRQVRRAVGVYAGATRPRSFHNH